MTSQTESLIEQGNKEIEAGETAGPFDGAEEAISYLKKYNLKCPYSISFTKSFLINLRS